MRTKYSNLTLEERLTRDCRRGHPAEGNKYITKHGKREYISCRACVNWHTAKTYKARKAKDPEGFRIKIRQKALAKAYGITLEDYDKLFEAQNGKCAICFEPGTKFGFKECLRVDHDHETGEIRGLLCNWCNMALGQFKDSAERLLSAAQYLIKAKEKLNSGE